MKLLLLTSLFMFNALPSISGEYQPGFSRTRTCTRNEYREEYVPGDRNKPGYVRTWEETVEVPCEPTATTIPNVDSYSTYDTNDCSEGTVAGGLLGGGIATAISRGKDRWWAIPAGIIGGSMVGCQIDGG